MAESADPCQQASLLAKLALATLANTCRQHSLSNDNGSATDHLHTLMAAGAESSVHRAGSRSREASGVVTAPGVQKKSSQGRGHCQALHIEYGAPAAVDLDHTR